MRGIRAIIFDLNGTLLDDYAYNVKAFQMVFDRFGLSVSEDEINQWMGKPTSFIIRQILAENGIQADWAELAREKVENYVRLTEGKDVFFPDAKEAISVLHEHYVLGLFTGVTRRQVALLGDFLGHFEMVIAGEEALQPKPSPDTLLYMAEKMRVDPHEGAYVGDMPQDMILALNAGMTGIGIRSDLFTERVLRESGAGRVFGNLKEFAEWALSHPAHSIP